MEIENFDAYINSYSEMHINKIRLERDKKQFH